MSKQTWHIAASLETLRAQLNKAFPKRSKVSDGAIGNSEHSARASDHNPNENHTVCARDFTHDPATGIDCQWLADTLVKNKDSRIKYIIWNHRICAGRKGPSAWVWRPYSGKNSHTHHLHLSVHTAPSIAESTAEWALDFPNNAKVNDVAKGSAAQLTPSTIKEGSALETAMSVPASDAAEINSDVDAGAVGGSVFQQASKILRQTDETPTDPAEGSPQTAESGGLIQNITQQADSLGDQFQKVQDAFGKFGYSNPNAEVSKSSWFITAVKAIIGFFLAAWGVFKDNWEIIAIGALILIVAAWFISRAKDRQLATKLGVIPPK